MTAILAADVIAAFQFPPLDPAIARRAFRDIAPRDAGAMLDLIVSDTRRRLDALAASTARGDTHAFGQTAEALASLLGHFGFVRASLFALAMRPHSTGAPSALPLLEDICEAAFRACGAALEAAEIRAA